MMTKLFLILVCLSGAAFAADADPELDAILELKADQIEQVETFDAVIESELRSDAEPLTATPKRMRMRLSYDKPRGAMRIRPMNENGDTQSGLLIEGTDVRLRLPDGSWRTLPLDPQTRATLEELGVDFSQAKAQRGLGGQAKPKRLRQMKSAEAQGERRARRLGRVRQWREKHEFRRMAGQDKLADGGRRWKAVLQRPKVRGEKAGFEAKLEWVDEASGLVKETALLAKPEDAERHWGAKAQAHRQKRRRFRMDDGSEMVEVGHTRLTKTIQRQGIELPEETESVNSTALGEVRQVMRWKDVRANEDLEPGTFEAK